MTTTISSKGQVVIPKPVRDRRNIRSGDDFEVLTPEDTDDIVLRKVQRLPNQGLAELLRKAPRGLTIPPRRRHMPRKPPQF
jgi:AbrB family looped-hinge helix DNA binding protein